MLTPFEYRQTDRKCFCRGCDSEIEKKSEKAVFWYNSINRGTHVILCVDCIKQLNKIIMEEE